MRYLGAQSNAKDLVAQEQLSALISNPMTSIRDLIVGGIGGAPTRLAGPTSEGLVLTRIGNALAWAIATGFANPMTAGGDLIIGGTNGAATRLGAGTAGQVLTMVAGAPAWVTPSGGGGGGDFKADGSVQMTGALNLAVRASHNTDSAGGVIPVAKVAASNTITVVGGAALTGMAGQPEGAERVLFFAQALQLTHSGSSFNLLTGASITAAVGDWARFSSNGLNAGWTMTAYSPYSGQALVGFIGGRLTKALDEANYTDGGFGVADGVLILNEATSNTIVVPGNPTITRITGGSGKGTIRRLLFESGGTLVNSSDYLDLPGSADLVLQNRDVVIMLAVSATKWRVVGGMRKNGQALSAGAGFTEDQVRATVLTGLEPARDDVRATDTVLAAMGKLQASKVTKIDGMGLSATDFSQEEKTKLNGIQPGAQVNAVTSVAGRTGTVTLTKSDVGLANADNTADSAKPVSVAQQAALDLKAPINTPSFTGGATVNGTASVVDGDLSIRRTSGAVQFVLNAAAGNYRYFRYLTNNSVRWDFGISNGAESGSDAGSDFYINAFSDTAAFLSSPWGITRATGETRMTRAAISGPVRVGQYTLTTLPAASAFSGYEIDVTNATVAPAGPKRCRSNGVNWLILNTNTPVS
jgi:hypothetical protein